MITRCVCGSPLVKDRSRRCPAPLRHLKVPSGLVLVFLRCKACDARWTNGGRRPEVALTASDGRHVRVVSAVMIALFVVLYSGMVYVACLIGEP